MPCWYYEKEDLKNSPSIKDGMDYKTERRYRREGARFIMETGLNMGLGHNTIATGMKIQITKHFYMVFTNFLYV